jgi:LysR family glycine cleavage system transcriptional activator
MHHVDFAREDVDLAVRHGDGNWPGLHAVRLAAEQLFPVCSPKLLGGRPRLRKATDVAKFPIIHLGERKDWAKWLDAAGVTGVDLDQGLVVNRAAMLIDAAVDGQGVVLARTTLSAWDILNGRLVRPFATSLRLSKCYWIVCPQATAMLPKIKAARDWMLAEAADDARRLKALQATRR